MQDAKKRSNVESSDYGIEVTLKYRAMKYRAMKYRVMK